jgi:hypothetical protein
MYEDLFGCCSKQVCCPNCTLLIAPAICNRDDDDVTYLADIEFEVTETDFDEILEDNNISYKDDGVNVVPEERVKFLPRMDDGNLVFYKIVSISNLELTNEEKQMRNAVKRSGKIGKGLFCKRV